MVLSCVQQIRSMENHTTNSDVQLRFAIANTTTTTTIMSNISKKALSKMQHDDFIAEIDNVTEQLTKTRESLWACQDKLRVSENKVHQLEDHISELVSTRDTDIQVVKSLREENAKTLEEEAKARASLELMKKVFTKTQLRAKEDKETMALLREERDLLQMENKQLKKYTTLSNKDQIQLALTNRRSMETEKHLGTVLAKTQKELAEYKLKQEHAENAIKQLTQRLLQRGREETVTVEGKNQKITDLEKQVFATKQVLFDEETEDGILQEFTRHFGCAPLDDDLDAKISLGGPELVI